MTSERRHPAIAQLARRAFLKRCAGAAAAFAFARTAAAAPGEVNEKQPRVAIVFFSKTGHTASLAAAAAKMTGGKTYRVETVEPYPEDYTTATKVVKAEIEAGTVRELKPLDVPLAEFDAIILASPTWWHHIASPLESWIKAHAAELAGKSVLTANTHGGGGLMHTREDFERLLPKSKLGPHFTVFGGVNNDDPEVRAWLERGGLIP